MVPKAGGAPSRAQANRWAYQTGPFVVGVQPASTSARATARAAATRLASADGATNGGQLSLPERATSTGSSPGAVARAWKAALRRLADHVSSQVQVASRTAADGVAFARPFLVGRCGAVALRAARAAAGRRAGCGLVTGRRAPGRFVDRPLVAGVGVAGWLVDRPFAGGGGVARWFGPWLVGGGGEGGGRAARRAGGWGGGPAGW